MKRFVCLPPCSLFFLGLLFCLSACAAPAAQLPTTLTTPPAAPTATFTLAAPIPTLSPSPSAAPLPSDTPAPLMVTPLPTIPTFTPTFDARTIVTATPGKSTKCLSNVAMKFALPTEDSKSHRENYKAAIQNFLNQGGDIQEIYNAFQLDKSVRNGVLFQDVTNDGMPELIWGIYDGSGGGNEIYGCNPQNSTYQLLYQADISNPDYYWVAGIRDMNMNGVPEIVFLNESCTAGRCTTIFITEWDGEKFKNLILQGDENIDFTEWTMANDLTDIELTDLNNNGTVDVIWKGGVQWPWIDPKAQIKSYYREETHTYSWNGVYFSELPIRHTHAIYRFQAVNDADQKTLIGEYALALAFYQDVIFDDKLDSWSKERELQLVPRLETSFGTPTPTAFPADPTEYPRLAAYAYYRMIALHTYLGESTAAQTQYATLQTKFPAGNPGHPYAEMATAFWDAHQSTGKMYDACAAAIAYADAHPEILTPLGSDYHGWQSHTYVPADVCPFR